MENGAHALYMAFAIFVFVLAISLAFMTFSQAREVSDLVLYYNDKTNFEEYVTSLSINDKYVNRLVGLEVIIPLIRNYVYESDNYSIEVQIGDKTYLFDKDEQGQNGSKSDYKDYCERELKEILKEYKAHEGAQFKEVFSEFPQVGGLIKFADGETLEKINTLTKVNIRYILN